MKQKIQKIVEIPLIALSLLAGCTAEAPGESASSKPQLEILGASETDVHRAMDNRTRQVDAKQSELKAIQKIKGSKKPYTIMIYMVGSNLESRNGAATNDLREIEAADVDYSKTNIIVLAGGSRRWNCGVPNTQNSVLDMSMPEEERIVASTDETADMGSSFTLGSFINYCTKNYPAEHYGLICWNHGGGPVWGYGADELFSNDSLLLQEIREGMDSTIFAKDTKLDFVGFDACLMGSIELASLWKDYASYMVGSEELEAGDGWDYSFLEILNTEPDPKDVVMSVVDAYGSYYEENQTEFFHPDATLAVLDLSKTDDFVQAMDRFYARICGDYDEETYAEISQILSKVKAFGLSASGSAEDSFDLIDVLDFVSRFEDRYPDEVNDVRTNLEQFVVHQTTNVDHVSGLSMYFPGENKQLYEESMEIDTYQTDSAQELAGLHSRAKAGETETDWKLAKPEYHDHEITLQLTDDQAKDLKKAVYTIMRRNEVNGYSFSLCNVIVEPDENNVLHVPEDPEVIGAVSDLSESADPWSFVMTEKSDGSESLKTIRTFLSSGSDFKDFDSRADEEVQITVQLKNGSDQVLINDITASENGAGLAGKGSIDASRYKTIIDGAFGSYKPERDADGNMKPFYEWKSGGIEYTPVDLESNFHFEKRHLSDYKEEFIIQFICRDVHDESHATEYIDLPFLGAEDHQSMTSGNGKLYYVLSDDHAEITGFEGEDEELRIPSAIEGKPVTLVSQRYAAYPETLKKVILPDSVTTVDEDAFYRTKSLEEIRLPAGLKTIGPRAFRGCESLKQIELPEGLESIGRAAFDECGLESVTLPSSLNSIGGMPFGRCGSLQEIRVSEKNTAYRDIDGVLFNKDGKILIQFPGGKKGGYEIPEGCESIGYGAFAECVLEKVLMPETLKKIGNDAFYAAASLKEIRFPDSLEEIGECVFADEYGYMWNREERPVIESVHIGRNVRYIGAKTFNGLRLTKFEVDPANPTYASSGGFLTNKAGDTILESPREMGELIVIPESVTTLNIGILEDIDTAKEFFVPDNTFRFAERTFPIDTYGEDENGNSIPLYSVIIHCSEGSAAEAYAQKYNIQFDHVTDPAMRVKERVSETTESGEMFFDVYPDHAAFIAYQGEDTVLTVPDTIKDVPVTEIYEGEPPEGSPAAFDPSGTTTLNLPRKLESFEPKILSSFWGLEEINIPEDAENFTSNGKMLFSGDGKQLIVCLNYDEDGVITVPEGTEVICTDAFVSNINTEKVILPESLLEIQKNGLGGVHYLKEVQFGSHLKTIGEHAFGFTELENPVLPDSVETIGNYVFVTGENMRDFHLPANLKAVGNYAFYNNKEQHRIGDDVIHIGKDTKVTGSSFCGILFDGFEVDSGNELYSTDGIFLMDREKTKIISAATAVSGTVTVPDGIQHLEMYSFSFSPGITDVVIPDSVIGFSSPFKADYTAEQRYSITIHCHKNTEAARYAESNGIPWVDDIE